MNEWKSPRIAFVVPKREENAQFFHPSENVFFHSFLLIIFFCLIWRFISFILKKMRILFLRNEYYLRCRNCTCGYMYVRQPLWHKKLFPKIDKQTKIIIFHWVSSAFLGRHHMPNKSDHNPKYRIIAVMVYLQTLSHPTLHMKVPFYKWGASPWS